MKAKTHEKTNPKQERIVNFRDLTDKSSILSRNLGAQTSQNDISRVSRLPKWLLQAPRQCQGGVRGSQGGPGEAKQESQRLSGDAQSSLGAAWAGSGTCLRDPQGQFCIKF